MWGVGCGMWDVVEREEHVNKTTVYILLVVVLIVGLVAGYVGATTLGPAGAGEVRSCCWIAMATR